MEGISLTPQQEKLKALQELLPEAFAEGKIDWEKLKATLGEDINFSNERYVLNWAGKSDAFKVLQTPSTKTLVPAKDESINFDTTENIFIEGENLEVLKVLQKSYFGKVKMIYIDPPYNTGNDSFIYPDKFSETKAEYEKRVGDKDEEGYMTKDGMFKKNSKENGQYHSNWLSMMMPRLYLAKSLLRQDGVIFVSIDDNEVHNLRLLMNEIFGNDNFVAYFKWNKTSTPPSLSSKVRHKYEFVLCYEKTKDNKEYNGGISEGGDMPLLNEGNKIAEIIIPRDKVLFNFSGVFKKGKYDRVELLNDITINKDGEANENLLIKGPFKWSQNNVNKEIENNTTFIVKSKKFAIRYIKDGIRFKKPADIISKTECNVGTNEDGSKDIETLFGSNIMSFPKPVSLIKYIAQFKTFNNDIILDFFAGSGTTAQAVMDLNKEDGGSRNYICVQLPELTDEKSEAYEAGYKTIAEISKERIRRAEKKIQEEINSEIKKIESVIKKLQGEIPTDENDTEIENLKNKIDQLKNQDLGCKVMKLEESNFKQWQQIEGKDAKALTEQMQLFIDPVSENATIENMVYEFLLKSGKDLNSKIEKRNEYFVINNSELIMLLESVSQTIIEQVIGEKPMKVIALDKLFKDNDQLKTNTVLQMRDAGIEFKTI